LIQDSGGPGQYRGGLGIRREYLNLSDARFSIRSAKHVIAPNGAAGGGEGRTGDIVVNPGLEGEKRLPTRYADYPLKDGDVFRLDTPGGGGLGTARLREPEKVLADVQEGYVSPARAREDYGVVLIQDGASFAVDESATETLRKSLSIGV
jgi:N-methylhydantoinase B